MKISDIEVGAFYHDGKAGVRKVLAIGRDHEGIELVEYRILAARAMQEYSHIEGRMVSIIGTTSSCHYASFAAWAKVRLSESACKDLLMNMQVRALKLSVGEQVFMMSILNEVDGEILQGTLVSYDHTEGRAAGGLEKKGLVVRHKGEVEITPLGSEWLKHQRDQE